MKTFSCRDIGFRCDFAAHGETNDEVQQQVAQHARAAHGMSITPDLANRIQWLIRDEAKDASGAV